MQITMPAPLHAVDAARAEAERRVFAKIGWRLMPILIISYILNYLDRTNVSFAALTMNEAHRADDDAVRDSAPASSSSATACSKFRATWSLYRVGARLWISRIMITWGLVSAAMSLAVGPNSFYCLRFLLGAAEAGFFPGIAFYLATWFPAEYRTRIIAWFMVAIPISSVIGGPVSGLLLGMDGIGGLAGWQWLFIAEGLPVVFVGASLLWLLADRPEDAAWLTDDEQAHRARASAGRAEAERGQAPVGGACGSRASGSLPACSSDFSSVPMGLDLPAADSREPATCPTLRSGSSAAAAMRVPASA